jgi:hypothetical protein
MTRYRALVGLDYGSKRAEAGEVRDDIPERSLPWLLEQGLVEEDCGHAGCEFVDLTEPNGRHAGAVAHVADCDRGED